MLMEREMDKFVVNYVVNNLTITILSGQNEVDWHWHCTRVLLHYVTKKTSNSKGLKDSY